MTPPTGSRFESLHQMSKSESAGTLACHQLLSLGPRRQSLPRQFWEWDAKEQRSSKGHEARRVSQHGLCGADTTGAAQPPSCLRIVRPGARGQRCLSTGSGLPWPRKLRRTHSTGPGEVLSWHTCKSEEAELRDGGMDVKMAPTRDPRQ